MHWFLKFIFGIVLYMFRAERERKREREEKKKIPELRFYILYEGWNFNLLEPEFYI